MQLLVCEFICGGSSDELLDSSLQREGAAMLAAIAADFALVDGCRVTSLWDERLGPYPIEGVDVVAVRSADQAMRLFRHYAATCDATFDIAPELDGILLERRQLVDNVGGRYLGPSAAAIELCGDKLSLAEHCLTHGIRTIETAAITEVSAQCMSFPLVIKRRDGAGSLGMRLVQNAANWDWLRKDASAESTQDRTIVQPFVEGRQLSVTAIVGRNGAEIDIFPAAEQWLSDDGGFRYLGGRIPAPSIIQEPVLDLVRKTVESIPGLAGYVGFDILLPDGPAAEPLLVEINPRLTTSYLGYRALAEENLAERLLFPERQCGPIRWKSRGVEFSPAGIIRHLN